MNKTETAQEEILRVARAVLAEFVAPGDVMKASTMRDLRDAIQRLEEEVA